MRALSFFSFLRTYKYYISFDKGRGDEGFFFLEFMVVGWDVEECIIETTRKQLVHLRNLLLG